MSNLFTRIFCGIFLVAFLSTSTGALAGSSGGVQSQERMKTDGQDRCEDTSEADKATVMKLRPLASVGEVKAQYELGLMYERGRGVKQDYAEAASWYLKAAEQGSAPAQFSLGQMYDIGKGIQQDYAKAASWYRKAAEQGEALAQLHLGFLFEYGQGVPADMVQAYKWYSLAALSSNEIAPRIKKAAESKMSKKEIMEAKKLADSWAAYRK